MVKPKIKLIDQGYDEPEFPARLQWYDVYRGQKIAGELLASFELLQARFPLIVVERFEILSNCFSTTFSINVIVSMSSVST